MSTIEIDYMQRRRRMLLIAWGLGLAAIVATVSISMTWLSPTPPRVVGIATDSETSGSTELADRYRDVLARDGIQLRLIPTAGAVDSAARLRDPKSGVSVAILPDGITDRRESPDLVSLGTLFYEPIWFFYRGPPTEDVRTRLARRPISVGPEGSATRKLSIEFLNRAGVIQADDPQLVGLAPAAAADALRAGHIDAAVMLQPWQSTVIHSLISAPDISLLDLRRADAFVALYPYLNKVVVPEGVGDLARDIPPQKTVLLAPKASLIVRDDLHPAIQYLLLKAASQIQSAPGLFSKAGRFPAAESVNLPLSESAIQYYKSGLPFLQRYLPFRLAVLAQQVLFLVIPLVGVLYPLLRLLPAVYGWVMRHRVLSLYGELKFLEDQFTAGEPPRERATLVARLDDLDRRANRFRVPIAFRPLLYNLRLYIALVRQRIERGDQGATQPDEATG